jgi:hypothetical protein
MAATFMIAPLPDMIGCLCVVWAYGGCALRQKVNVLEYSTEMHTSVPQAVLAFLTHNHHMRLQHTHVRPEKISSAWRQGLVPLREPQNNSLSQSGPGTDVIETAEFIPQGPGWFKGGCYLLAVLISLAGRTSRKDVATFELELGDFRSSFKGNAEDHTSPVSPRKLSTFQSWLGPWVLLCAPSLFLHSLCLLFRTSHTTQVQNMADKGWIVFMARHAQNCIACSMFARTIADHLLLSLSLTQEESMSKFTQF